ncbi:methyltransferase [Nocardiopsis sp. MG754419]|uniref:methyltransferase n=1 Tax=Nocardiopsis sp. MG754419 TaxID=2259865 RepID=UPI001BA6079D|nr:methyltransferase [Nocardiopsis sp. MG754419]MBR8741222.1 methyltransferase [Nocardiopsis sp. MG754419]
MTTDQTFESEEQRAAGALAAEMTGMLAGFTTSQALYAVAKFDIATALLDGPRTVAELAAGAEVREDPLRRLLHTVTGVGAVRHEDGDRFALTPLGRTLASGTPESVRGTALFWMETHYEPLGALTDVLRTGRSGYELRQGKGFVEYIREHPEHIPSLTAAMSELTAGPRQALLSDYRLPAGDVVADIGGADGSVLATLLADEPDRRGIVLDLPGVAPAAERRMREVGLADRVSVIGGDFFEEIPTADVYLLSTVLHDWDDADCGRLLDRIAQAAAPNARLVVIETFLPEGDAPHPGKLSDLIMMAVAGGRERTVAEFTALLGAADFTVDACLPAPAGGYCVIEATLEPA